MKLAHQRWIAKFLLMASVMSTAHAGSFDDYFSAIQQDNAAKVKELLIRGIDPNMTNPKGQSGLYLALSEPSPKTTQLLVTWPKTDVNKLNSKGESPLMVASLKGNQQVAEALIKRGGDVNKTGWTPLHYAATGGYVALIGLLLDNSAYIDAESPNGTTPLMMAAMYGSGDAVKLLLQEGADPGLTNQQGLTAMDFAQRGSRPDAIKALDKQMLPINSPKSPTGKW